MYSYLLIFHSFVRWLVLFFLLFTLIRCIRGIVFRKNFEKWDNLGRILLITFSHFQLILGFFLYFKSPIIRSFFQDPAGAFQISDLRFFAVIHISIMIISVVFLTIGSAISKRKKEDSEKFKNLFVWTLISIILILIAIPWPFSPFAHRPYIREF
ncbi:hypothetical protein EHO58_18690 [Leptospira selangorensis]|uniref:hypothetical protein n=1 Tax=Leptospira selangorensis TaxID=2484982 RepID=UPI001083FC7A|nr:hypothetical protein [Leptospira selangorensis]TGK00483.1 hypothetical protein EHO58_18690 [Leptospira selangorensis]